MLDEIAPRLALAKVRAAKKPALSSASGSRGKRSSAKRQIIVCSVVKPEIDTERLARALMAFVLQTPHEPESDSQPDATSTAS